MAVLFKLPRYDYVVLAVYLLSIPLLTYFFSDQLKYRLEADSFGLASLVTGIVFLSFYFLNKVLKLLDFKIHKLNFSTAVVTFLYALVFAFPEEMIFRGIIQGYLGEVTGYPIFAIILSSLIFGLAHLPNGSVSLKPSGWNWRFARIAFLGGLFLGTIFFLTDSLLMPTALHAFFLIFYKFFLSK